MIRSLSRGALVQLADRFAYGRPDPVIKRASRLSRVDFLTICKWKSERRYSSCELNHAEDVERLTEAAFCSTDAKVQILTLTALHGVGLPTASALLHWGHAEGPILDFRTWWTVFEGERATFLVNDWLRFRQRMTAEAAEYGVGLRELDKATWQYSLENQRVAQD